MIPLKDDNPTSSRPIVTYFLIGLCVVVFLMQLGSQSYRTGQLFYSYGLIPSVLMGHDQLTNGSLCCTSLHDDFFFNVYAWWMDTFDW